MKNEEIFLTAVKVWAATAWADGIMADNERELLDGVIRNAQVSDDTRAAALSCLTARVDLKDAAVDRLSASERAGVYRTACRLATVDRQLNRAEKAFLRRLGKRLGLDDAETAAMQAEYLRPVGGGPLKARRRKR